MSVPLDGGIRLGVCSLLGSAALAQQQESKIKLAINDGQGDDLVIRINGKDQDLDLHKLQLGESRSVHTVDGRPVLITRVADGYTFDVDGRQITMPMADHEAGAGHREVRVMRHVGAGPGPHPDGVTILSPGPLDDATRASITSTLAAAGMTEVRFIDTADMGPGSQRCMPTTAAGRNQGTAGNSQRSRRNKLNPLMRFVSFF